MQKIINNKLYDTCADNVEQVGYFSLGRGGRGNVHSITFYKTSKGNIFYEESGHNVKTDLFESNEEKLKELHKEYNPEYYIKTYGDNEIEIA